jgi:hypothetical protein
VADRVMSSPSGPRTVVLRREVRRPAGQGGGHVRGGEWEQLERQTLYSTGECKTVLSTQEQMRPTSAGALSGSVVAHHM